MSREVGEFEGRTPIGIGVVRGARAWRVDSAGRLLPINSERPWRPGENKKACSVSHGKHKMEDCTCGFYAFYEGSNDYHGSIGRISGVIEAYGEVFIGTRGFRAEKARIVALCAPPKLRPNGRLATWLGRHGLETSAGMGGMSLAIVVLVVGVWLGVSSKWEAWPVCTVLFALFPVLFYITVAGMRADSSSLRYDEPELATIFMKVRRNYPGIPVFDSFKEMVEAFPPDGGDAPTPENDPSFWGDR